MEKKGLFTGCKDVISFTAVQNAKGNGFKKSTAIVGFIIAAVFALISILMAAFQDDDEGSGAEGEDGYENIVQEDMDSISHISKVYLVNSDIFEDKNTEAMVMSALSMEGLLNEKLEIEYIEDDSANTIVSNNDTVLVVRLEETEDGRYEFCTLVKKDGIVGEEIADTYMSYVIKLIDSISYQMAGVSAEDIIYMEAPYYTMSLSVEDDKNGFAVTLTGMLVPMLFSFLMFGMVYMHGQSIMKSVIAEKSSKLMEYLLTSIKPYALITGKVVALSGMAIIQLVIWIVCGVAGYYVGIYAAEAINPNYTNYFSLIMEAMSAETDATAFSIPAIIIAIVSMIVGFVMFCVIAALIASAISKIEDMSTTQTLFQIPVMIGWGVAYIVPLAGSDTMITVANVAPITAPFILPANVILGSCSIMEGVISLGLMLLTTLVLVIITGRVYKGKIFNRR